MRPEDFDAAHKLSQHEFTERCGDPARLIYKGQSYDAGTESANLCAACGGNIRFCYVLKVLSYVHFLLTKTLYSTNVFDPAPLFPRMPDSTRHVNSVTWESANASRRSL